MHVRAHVSEVAAGGKRTEPLLAKCASPLAATADKGTDTDFVAVSAPPRADKQVQAQPTGAAPFMFEEHHRARRSAPSTDNKGTTADLKPANVDAAVQADIAGPAPKHAPWALVAPLPGTDPHPRQSKFALKHPLFDYDKPHLRRQVNAPPLPHHAATKAPAFTFGGATSAQRSDSGRSFGQGGAAPGSVIFTRFFYNRKFRRTTRRGVCCFRSAPRNKLETVFGAELGPSLKKQRALLFGVTRHHASNQFSAYKS